MMQFNPLFLNMSQALPELSKPDKFGGVSYLFSDIIKVFLSENDEQSSEDQKVLSAAGDQIKSLIDVFNKTGKEINNENKIETIHGKKLKLSLDEISDSSVQKVFAGIANEVLQAGTEISVKKGSENSIRKIELNSAVPEDDAAKTISLFIEKINENFGMKEIDKAAFNAPQLKATGTIQSPVSPEINQNLNGNNGEISSVAGTNSIKFKLESPGELLTFELTKPEKEPLTNIGNKNLSVFNNFPEPGQRDFKLQVTYSVNSQDEPIQNLTSNFGQINADKIYKEPESLKSIYTGDLKVEPEDKPVIQSADTFVHDETSDPKPGSTENRQVEEDIKPDVPAQGKLFSKESEILKSIYQEQSNIEDESKSIPSNKLINSIEKPQIENDITPAVQLSDKLFNNETENVKSIYDGSLNSGDENKSVPANNLNNK
ncbi:MAG TPA: hypothetical protein VMT35_07995, partial [Ignavibacteriaceae bacterium]|nr:hypothetical protein [Ignavibacteriaceae bacterium]